MTVRFQFRRSFTADVPPTMVLAAGEPGIELTPIGGGAYQPRLKIGDGVTQWVNLPYADATSAIPDLDMQVPGGTPALRGPGSPDLYGETMKQARAGWAKKATRPFVIWEIGDSTGVGWTATTEQQGFMALLNSQLYQLAGQAEPGGYISANDVFCSYPGKKPTYSGGSDSALSGPGYGQRNIEDNGTVTFPAVVCDRIWVLYPDMQFNGQFNVKVDGVVQGTIAPINTGTPTVGSKVWTSNALSLASHTVVLTNTDGLNFPSQVEGVMFFRGNGNTSGSVGSLTAANARTGSGLRIVKGPRFGATTASFAAASANGCKWWDSIISGHLPPDLVIISLGINDSGTLTTAQVKTNLNNIVANVNAAMVTAGMNYVPSYLFNVPWQVGANASVFPPFQTAIYEAAETNGAAILDMTHLMGFVGTAAADVNTIMSGLDPSGAKVHPNDDGHRLFAAAASSFFKRALFGNVQTPITVTGSKSANAALTSLITALAQQGLIIDSTS